MEDKNFSLFTVIYTCENSLQILHDVIEFETAGDNRINIPESFKEGKIIIAVCKGSVSILNRLGDRAYELLHDTAEQ